MAEPAGRVNDRGRENDAAFIEIIAESSDAIQELARAVRDLIYDVLPQTVEVLWPRQRTVGWGTGPKKFTEQFAYLMPFQRHVTVGFYHGGELPDPRGLLPDGGGRQAGGSHHAQPADQLTRAGPRPGPARPHRGRDRHRCTADLN